MGVVKEPGMALTMKGVFLEEGIFTIRLAALGPNKCLLEDLIEGETTNFIEERGDWWKVWFKEIKLCNENDEDLERITRINCIGIPCHTWSKEFFDSISSTLGVFLNSDDNTFSKVCMGATMLRIRTTYLQVINEIIPVKINSVIFRIFVKEDFLSSSNIQKRSSPAGTNMESSEYSGDYSSDNNANGEREPDSDEGGIPNKETLINYMENINKTGKENGVDELHKFDKEEGKEDFRKDIEYTLIKGLSVVSS